jgi:DNA helicase IV
LDPHTDVVEEQGYLDHAYRCLASMRDRAQRAVGIAEEAAAADDVDSAAAAWHLRRRTASLDPDLPALSFGRLDELTGDTWYVGRRHVEDDVGDPVVVDWRADVSVPFYRATAADDFGLKRRRRFMMDGKQLVDLMDEVFDDPDSVHAAMHGGIPDPLLAELERARTGEMRDIVATIQAEQDVVIRAPLDACLVVQGGPGTGKTAVGLHRAAFLLYEHRRTLDEQGVLVVGPNPVFLRYIAQVLPSLGESAVRQTTIERLLGGRVRAFDSDETARLKGDVRMAAVIDRACAAQVRPPVDDIELSTHWGRLVIPAGAVRAAVDEITARGVAHNVGRNALRTQLNRLAYQQHLERRGDDPAPPDSFEADLRANRTWQAALTRMWPAVSGAALVRRLLTSRAALGAAADGLLDGGEQVRLLRKAASKLDDEQWSAADLVLVDEAEWRANGATPTYGHVVVDEAQDLSAMEFRLLARRCPSRSMTILGDLAQATAPGAQRSWDTAFATLGSPALGQLAVLEVGYRVPGPVLDVANRLLPIAAPDVVPSRSVRTAGPEPDFVAVDDLAAGVAHAAAAAAGRWTSVGVVVPDDALDGVADALRAAGVEFGDGLRAVDGAKVTLVGPTNAKGLEFDAMVVGEPAAIMGDTARGARLLYIAMTRAVQELVVVHREPVPRVLTGAATPLSR